MGQRHISLGLSMQKAHSKSGSEDELRKRWGRDAEEMGTLQFGISSETENCSNIVCGEVKTSR